MEKNMSYHVTRVLFMNGSQPFQMGKKVWNFFLESDLRGMLLQIPLFELFVLT